MKIILIFLSSLLLIGCQQELEIKTSPTKIDIIKPADPSPVKMQGVAWRVITKENLDTFLSEMKSSQGTDNFVFIAITGKDYENIMVNIADLKRYIEQQQAIIVYYKNITTNTK